MRYCAIIIVYAFACLPTHAQVADNLTADINLCRAVSDPESRLSCYDNIADTMSEREEKRAEELANSVAAAKNIAEQNFGLREDTQAAEVKPPSQITPEAQAILEATKDPEQIDSEITKVSISRGGKKIIFLTNGQAWIETSASKLRAKPKAGEKVTIKKAGLSWFRIRFSDTYGVMAARRVK